MISRSFAVVVGLAAFLKDFGIGWSLAIGFGTLLGMAVAQEAAFPFLPIRFQRRAFEAWKKELRSLKADNPAAYDFVVKPIHHWMDLGIMDDAFDQGGMRQAVEAYLIFLKNLDAFLTDLFADSNEERKP